MIKINKYTLNKHPIGSGAFSKIYKCRDDDDNIFAIKQINISKIKKRRIINEFNILRKLSHINIIKVFDIIMPSENENYIYILLDYYEFGDLGKYIRTTYMNNITINNFSIQIKDGLNYLFNNNIVHRDIKPQNILLSKNNILKIIDFGLSKTFTVDMMDTICGSPLYMAPEIIMNKQYTIKSDIWSFGIIIYEMVYGFIPFKSNNIVGIIHSLKNKELKFSTYNVPEECINLLKSMLVQDPANRISWSSLFIHPWFTNNLLLNLENNLIENAFSDSYIYKESVYPDILEDDYMNSVSSSIYYSFSEEEDDDYEEGEINSNPSFIKYQSEPINIKPYDEFVMVDRENINYLEEGKSISDNMKDYISNSIHFVKNSYDYINKSSSL